MADEEAPGPLFPVETLEKQNSQELEATRLSIDT